MRSIDEAKDAEFGDLDAAARHAARLDISTSVAMADGRRHRWAVDGPAVAGLAAMGVEQDSLEPGGVIEVCGFAAKEGALAQKTSPPASAGGESAGAALSGQLMNGHLLVLKDLQKRFWSDYGQLRQCISDEERATLPRDWRRTSSGQ